MRVLVTLFGKEPDVTSKLLVFGHKKKGGDVLIRLQRHPWKQYTVGCSPSHKVWGQECVSWVSLRFDGIISQVIGTAGGTIAVKKFHEKP